MKCYSRWLAAGAVASIAAAIVLASSIVSTSCMAQSSSKIERLVTFFDIVVFGSEIEGIQTDQKIRKWTRKDIRYKLGGFTKKAKLYRPTIEKHLRSLEPFTGLKFREVPGNLPDDEIIIWFSNRERMVSDGLRLSGGTDERFIRRVATGRCYFLSFHDNTGSLLKARIVINIQHEFKAIEHCLLEELAQALGLPNDDPTVSPSIFNDGENHLSLTFIDKVLIRTLYDRRMPVGTPKAKAIEFARAIINDLSQRAKK